MNIKMRDPIGVTIEDPTLEYLRSIVLHSSSYGWHDPAGNGEVSLDAETNKGRAVLSLIRHPDLGFVVQHQFFDVEDGFVAIVSHDYEAQTEVILCGEPWRIPIAFVLPPHRAWDAINEFAVSGERARSIEWVELLKQVW